MLAIHQSLKTVVLLLANAQYLSIYHPHQQMGTSGSCGVKFKSLAAFCNFLFLYLHRYFTDTSNMEFTEAHDYNSSDSGYLLDHFIAPLKVPAA